jgi:hypothetical protein
MTGLYDAGKDFVIIQRSGPARSTIAANQRIALTYGVLGRIWLNPKVGLEASVARATSDLSYGGPLLLPPPPASSTVTLATAAVLITLPVDLPNPTWVAGGLTLVGRSGPAYRGIDGRRSLGGVLGIGTSLHLTSRFHAELGARGLLYKLALTDSAGAYPTKRQLDLHVIVGLGILLGSERN